MTALFSINGQHTGNAVRQIRQIENTVFFDMANDDGEIIDCHDIGSGLVFFGVFFQKSSLHILFNRLQH